MTKKTIKTFEQKLKITDYSSEFIICQVTQNQDYI